MIDYKIANCCLACYLGTELVVQTKHFYIISDWLQSWTNCWKWKPNMAKIYVWEEREFYWKESLHLKLERLYKLLVFRIYYSEVRHNKCVRPHCQSVRQNEIIYVNIIISFLYHIFLTDRKYDYWSIIFLRYLNRPSIPT